MEQQKASIICSLTSRPYINMFLLDIYSAAEDQIK